MFADWGYKFDFITAGTGGDGFIIAENDAVSRSLTATSISSGSTVYFASPADAPEPTYWKYQLISGTSQTVYGQSRSAYKIYPADNSNLALTVPSSGNATLETYTGANNQLFYMVDIPDTPRLNLYETYKVTCGASVLKPRRYTSADKVASLGALYNGNDDAWALANGRLIAYNSIYTPKEYSTLVCGRNYAERDDWEPYFSAVSSLTENYTWYDGSGTAHTNNFTPVLNMYYDDANPGYWWFLMRRNVTNKWYPVTWTTGANGELTLMQSQTEFSSSSLPDASLRYHVERVQPYDASIPMPYGLSLVSGIGETDDTTTIMKLFGEATEPYLHFFCTGNPQGFQMRFRRTKEDGSWTAWTAWEPVVYSTTNESEYWAYNRPLYADSIMYESGVSAKIELELRATAAATAKWSAADDRLVTYAGKAASERFSYYRCDRPNLPLQDAEASFDDKGLHLTVTGLRLTADGWDAVSLHLRIKSLKNAAGDEYLLNEQTATFSGNGTWTIPLTEFAGVIPWDYDSHAALTRNLTAEVDLGIGETLDAYSYTATIRPNPATGQASILYEHNWTAADGQVLLRAVFEGEQFTLYDGEKFIELNETTIDGSTGFLLPRLSGDYRFLTTRNTGDTWSAFYWDTFSSESGTPSWTPAKSSALYWTDDDGEQHYLDLPTDTSAGVIQTQQQRISTTWQLDGRRRDAVSFAPTISTTKSISATMPNEKLDIGELESLQIAGHALYSNPAGGLVFVAITGITVEQHARYTTIQISMTEE